MYLVTVPHMEPEMTKQQIAVTYEQSLADLNRFHRDVIEATRAWATDPSLGESVSEMMEELRLRTLIVNTAQAMSTEQPLLTAAA